MHINTLWMFLCLYLSTLSLSIPPSLCSPSLFFIIITCSRVKWENRKQKPQGREAAMMCKIYISFTKPIHWLSRPWRSMYYQNTVYPLFSWEAMSARELLCQVITNRAPIEALCHLDLRLRLVCKQRNLDILSVFPHTFSFNCAVPVSTESNLEASTFRRPKRNRVLQ